MNELVASLHVHTTYSDGHSNHQHVAESALNNGIDLLITTDHNIYVHGLDGYYENENRRLLLLAGEEIHDRQREPQKNHLLVIGADQELTGFARDPQNLINQANRVGALSFIAHPIDPAMPDFKEGDISWEDWTVHDFSGIELWNGLSELKNVAHNKLQAVFYAFFPQYLAHGPLLAVLGIWDELLSQGKRITAVGGVDAHALPVHLGPLKRNIFPYAFHFRTIRTHLIVPEEISGDIIKDRRMVIEALRRGHGFIGYDLPAPTTGFRFTAQGRDQSASMGDEIKLNQSVTFQIRLPFATECRLLRDGLLVRSWTKHEICTFISNQPGVFRVECYINFKGKRRGWIFSNPIYVRK
jgi:hypothetical protein